MQWPFKILVSLVLAGMTLPVVRHMRAFSALRSAFAHEPPHVRVAALAFLIASVIYGGGKTNGLNRVGGDLPERGQLVRIDDGGDGGESPSWRDGFALPGWFALAGYNDADTDGDGIPDCWERWTGTTPLVADSSSDLDGDGLSNLDEFLLQTDPQCADTDNDAIDDALEAAAMLAGVADFDPLSPATYAAQEPDANTNGVPDAWEGTMANLFAGVAPDGFLWDLPVPDAETGTYDVALTVSSSRFALLAWGDDGDEAVLLPPCTNLAIRLRLDASETRTVSLSAAPSGAAAGALLGNWRAEMAVAWDSRRNLATEGDRVAVGDGTMVDCPTRAVAYRGALFGAGGQPSLRGGTPGAGGGPLEISFVPKWMHLIYQGGNSCAEHGPSPMVELVSTNVPPPYRWSHDLHRSVTDSTQYCAELPWLDYTSTTVSCREADGAHTNLLLQADILIGLGRCGPSGMNIIPAMAGSTHDPVDASDHEPELSQPETSQYSPLCPEATNVTLKAGWTHDTAILHIRNLVRIQTHNPWDDETDHSIGLVWSAGGATNLFYYLDDCCKPFADSFSYYVNGSPCDGMLEFGPKPDEFHPRVFHVELRLADGGTVLDRMWIVVNARESKGKFDTWYSENSTNFGWTASLPRPCSQLTFTDGEPHEGFGGTGNWSSPSPLGKSYMHHDAVYETRTYTTSEHGNQATFDKNGTLITEGIRAGTADLYAPYNSWGALRWNTNHRDQDVRPYIWSLQLDGNPAEPTSISIPTSLNRPLLFQGGNANKYLQCRPIVH